MRHASSLVLVLLCLWTSGCRTEPAPGRELSGSEISALFADKTVVGHHDRHGYDFRSYYAKDGSFRSHQNDKSAPRQAKWWVDTNDICIRWEDTPHETLCRRMFVDERGVYRKVKIVPGGDTIVVVTFKSFTPGNAEGL